MAEVKSQGVRRALINVVSSYDTSVVNQEAHEHSELFTAFLSKEIFTGTIDSMDYVSIIMELEDELDVEVTDVVFDTWHQLFDRLVSLSY